MEIFLNDLSICGQYSDVADFRIAFEPLLRLRSGRQDLQRILYCTSTFSTRPATPARCVREAIQETRDRTYISLALRWITSAGPFWDEDRFPQSDDYFHFDRQDVTDQGLGEASRRILGGIDSAVFSLLDKQGTFKASPLVVTHGLEEDPYGSVDVPNLWRLHELERVLNIAPTNWRVMIQNATARFHLLRLSPGIFDGLEGQPFHSGAAERVLVLLGVLQTLAQETKPDQSFTPMGLELWQKHTTGEKAWFTDESAENKAAFKNDMTFTDVDTGRRTFCPWHGKIKSPQFRIHFEWPRPQGQREIKVMYIGPKITKH